MASTDKSIVPKDGNIDQQKFERYIELTQQSDILSRFVQFLHYKLKNNLSNLSNEINEEKSKNNANLTELQIYETFCQEISFSFRVIPGTGIPYEVIPYTVMPNINIDQINELKNISYNELNHFVKWVYDEFTLIKKQHGSIDQIDKEINLINNFDIEKIQQFDKAFILKKDVFDLSANIINELKKNGDLLKLPISDLLKFKDKVANLKNIPTIKILIDSIYFKQYIYTPFFEYEQMLTDSQYMKNLLILALIKEIDFKNIDQNQTISEAIEKLTLLPCISYFFYYVETETADKIKILDFVSNNQITSQNITEYIKKFEQPCQIYKAADPEILIKTRCLSICLHSEGNIKINPDGLIKASEILECKKDEQLAFEAYKNTKSDFYKYYNNDSDISEELRIKALENNNLVKTQKSNKFFQLCKDHWVITFIVISCSTCGSVYIYYITNK